MLLRHAAFSCALLLPLLFPHPAQADHRILYECVDQEGIKQFTNIPPRSKAGCRVLHVGPLPSAPAAAQSAPAPAPKAAAKSATMPTPANFPRVDRETQQSRDTQRRRILEQELSNEQKLLEQAKKDLAEQEAVRHGNERNYQKVLERLEPYQRKVKQHEDNVVSLRKELSNIR